MKNLILATSLVAVTLSANAQTPLDLASKLTENERFEQATSAIMAVLAAEPTNGDAWFRLGENYYYNDKLDSAKYAYSRGVAVNPLMPLNAVGVAKVLQAQGKTAEARTAFDAAIANAIDKKNKMAKTMQAEVYREAAEGLTYGDVKDPATAVAFIEKSIELNPADPEAYIVKGDALFEQNPREASEPMANYKKAADLQRTSAKPVAKKAFMYYRAKNFDASITEYDNAIAIDPAYAPAYRGRAEAYYFKRDFTKATADYDKYLELNKGNESARVRYAQFLFLVEKYNESLDLISKLEEGGVKNKVLTRLKAYNYVELKDSVNAMPAIEAYMKEQPEDELIPSDLQYYGRAISMLGNDSLAGEKLLAAAKMKNSDPQLFMEAGGFFNKAKMYKRATEAYQGKTLSGKVEVNDYYYLGSTAQRAQEYAIADSAWAKYITYQPDIYQGYMGRARANVGLDPEKTTWQAKPFYEEVIRKMKPEEAAKSLADAEEANFYLAYYYYTSGDRGQAKCYFEKVSAINAGTGNTKIAMDMLTTKELKDLDPTPCELP
ncbi:MAG: tetratricopeptide repeat protein [Flavobacteriales bacterium]|nr:tetratricopeptide repeat protein [Flavobacteriales bacterium]MBK6944172.1 tetratricopeptide repeat protein [Flavobacteriales bacterium]MBK7240373.1 tetratricopeptide repeat protein [Flavobacteriales bacterium]MBK7295333.1 tetratricopeptide repeat protein [Flavobacteriales bacterium]MBK9533839.1 tetratricopeptide repeat protein [Flavobacteriales bacterium]